MECQKYLLLLFLKRVLKEWGSLISVVSHQGGLSPGWSLTRVVSQSGFSPGWSLTRLVSHQAGLSQGRALTRLVSHQGGLSSGWSLIRVISHQEDFIRVISHQGDFSLGSSFNRSMRCSTVPPKVAEPRDYNSQTGHQRG